MLYSEKRLRTEGFSVRNRTEDTMQEQGVILRTLSKECS
jgi:hypothetical protein